MNKSESISLSCREGKADAVYHAQLSNVGGDTYDLWNVTYQHGRRGDTLATGTKTTQPVSYDKAKKIYDKLVGEKTAPGRERRYTVDGASGTAYTDTSDSGRVSGYLPQLLNSITEHDVWTAIDSNEWCLQEKKDGKRMLVHVTKDGQIRGINRRGLTVELPVTIAHSLVMSGISDTVLDGESVGGTLWLFDCLMLGGEDITGRPYSERLKCVNLIALAAGEYVQMVRSQTNPLAKRRLLEQIQNEGGEGIVLKNLHARATAGRPASGGTQLKYKFVQTATCMVIAANGDKRSVYIACRDGSELKDVGRVTIKPNQEIPNPGELIEVRYLYYFPGGSLYQPVCLGVRDDLTVADSIQSLKAKQTTDEEDDS